MIKVSHLSKAFNGQTILDDISLGIAQGEIFAILGGSGAGKSVLLKHMVGLLKPDYGTVEINSQEITQLSERQLLLIRKTFGYLFQEGALYDFMTVFENVSFPLREHTRLDRLAIKTKVLDVLKLVGLKGAEDKFPSELSGGMKKRAALARSIVLESKVLFCDEPTSGLDPILSKDISDLIRDVSRRFKCTTVLTSHDIKNSFRIADRLTILHGGKIQTLGTIHEIQASRDPLVQEFIE